MSKLARAVAVTGLAAGLTLGAAPMAMADVIFNTENGPGDLANSTVSNSHHVLVPQLNKPVTTGDIKPHLKNVKNSPLTFEVEGPEQDQGEKS
jgi:hypothetical protein